MLVCFWMDGWMDGRTDGRTDGGTEGRMDGMGWMDDNLHLFSTPTDTTLIFICFSPDPLIFFLSKSSA